MPTTKKRLNISLTPELERMLEKVAKRDNVPEATKASALLELALEIEEDETYDQIAKKRDTRKSIFVSDVDAWK